MSFLIIEGLKLYKRKSTKNLIMLYSTLLFILSGLYFYGEKSMGITLFTEGQFISASLAMMMSVLLPFIALYLSSTSFALDFSKGTLKNMLLLPVKKSQIYLGKILAVQSLMGVLLSIQFMFTFTVGLLLDGGISLSLLLTTLMAYLGAFIVLGLVNTVGAVLSLLINSTGLALFISYLLYVGMGIASLYLPPLRAISFSHIMSSYSDIIMSLDFKLILSIIAYYLLFITLGHVLFEKKEESVCQYE